MVDLSSCFWSSPYRKTFPTTSRNSAPFNVRLSRCSWVQMMRAHCWRNWRTFPWPGEWLHLRPDQVMELDDAWHELVVRVTTIIRQLSARIFFVLSNKISGFRGNMASTVMWFPWQHSFHFIKFKAWMYVYLIHAGRTYMEVMVMRSWARIFSIRFSSTPLHRRFLITFLMYTVCYSVCISCMVAEFTCMC